MEDIAGRIEREVGSWDGVSTRPHRFGGLEFRTSSGGWATQNWDDVVRNALLMLDFGCAAHEDVWAVDGARVRLRKLAARLPLTFYRWHTELDGETLVALEQYGYRGGRYLNVTLPAEKIALFTYNQEGANFWGTALLRYMYPHWYVKSNLYRMDSIACERNALGIPDAEHAEDAPEAGNAIVVPVSCAVPDRRPGAPKRPVSPTENGGKL